MPERNRANTRQATVPNPKSDKLTKQIDPHSHTHQQYALGSPINKEYRIVGADDLPHAVMRILAWSCVIAGVLLGVAAFVITANTPLNPRPTLVAGFCLTAFGVILLTIRRDL